MGGVLSVCMNLSYSAHIWEFDGDPYYSLFPWICWFVLGFFYENILRVLGKWEERRVYGILVIVATCLTNILIMEKGVNYFSVYYIPFAIVNLIFLHYLSNKLFLFKRLQNILNAIGTQTLWIMFTNFYVTILCAKLLIQLDNGLFILGAPILTVVLLTGFALFLKYFEKKCNLKAVSIINQIIGIR